MWKFSSCLLSLLIVRIRLIKTKESVIFNLYLLSIYLACSLISIWGDSMRPTAGFHFPQKSSLHKFPRRLLSHRYQLLRKQNKFPILQLYLQLILLIQSQDWISICLSRMIQKMLLKTWIKYRKYQIQAALTSSLEKYEYLGDIPGATSILRTSLTPTSMCVAVYSGSSKACSVEWNT